MEIQILLVAAMENNILRSNKGGGTIEAECLEVRLSESNLVNRLKREGK